jgi:transcription elongation GreA/GreB family factor
MNKNPFYLTIETKVKLEKKVRELELKLLEAGNEIAEAADHGTWHDNFNYEQSHQKREFVEVQLNDLKDKLRRAKIIEPIAVTADDGTVYYLAGELDSDPKKNIISYTSPLGKNLLIKHRLTNFAH